MSEEEIERRDKERLAKISASKRRNYLAKKIADAQKLGLGDAVGLAEVIEKKRKELSREFTVHGNKGKRTLTSVEKTIAKRKKEQEKADKLAYHPRIKVKGLKGVTPDEDGRLDLQELRAQRPDIFERGSDPITPELRKKIDEGRARTVAARKAARAAAKGGAA